MDSKPEWHKGKEHPGNSPVTLDDALSEFQVSPGVVKAFKHVALIGGDLVDETTAGLFIGMVHGDLFMKGQLQLPLKKLIVFCISLLVLGLFFWTAIYPWFSHIQIGFK